MRKWNFKHPDIVSILTFAAYSGSVSRPHKMFFTSPAVNRIKPVLSKYFNVCWHEKEQKMYINSVEFINQAEHYGWVFSKHSNSKVPEYVFKNEKLFKVFLSTLIDCKASTWFAENKSNKTIRLKLTTTYPNGWDKLLFYLNYYGLPISFTYCMVDRSVKSGMQYDLVWNGSKVYTLLDFIGWDLQRPRNVAIMKYLRERQEIRTFGKHIFM